MLSFNVLAANECRTVTVAFGPRHDMCVCVCVCHSTEQCSLTLFHLDIQASCYDALRVIKKPFGLRCLGHTSMRLPPNSGHDSSLARKIHGFDLDYGIFRFFMRRYRVAPRVYAPNLSHWFVQCSYWRTRCLVAQPLVLLGLRC